MTQKGTAMGWQSMVPMLNVPDVQRTIEWYAELGFRVVKATRGAGADRRPNWAWLSRGEIHLMINAGDTTTAGQRHEVQLYILTEDVDAEYELLKDRVPVQAKLSETFYGMKEFLIEDINGFSICFGQRVKQETNAA
jgi:catechol 2,3-dioxygenase-like lactoylglutathione lyase family enzyme